MPLNVSDIMATSYSTMLREMREIRNPWAESALLRHLEARGMVERAGFDPNVVMVDNSLELLDDGSDEMKDA